MYTTKLYDQTSNLQNFQMFELISKRMYRKYCNHFVIQNTFKRTYMLCIKAIFSVEDLQNSLNNTTLMIFDNIPFECSKVS